MIYPPSRTRARVPGLVEIPPVSLHPEADGKNTGGRRPFTVSNLEITPSGFFELRLTALTSDCCRHFEYLFVNDLKPGSTLEIDRVPLVIRHLGLMPLEHPLCMRSSYPLLYQSSLEPVPGPQWFELQFVSPVVFSRRDSQADLALPLPELVFGGLAAVWNEMFGHEIISSQEVRELAYSGLAISEFKLQSTMTPKKNGVYKGAIGRVRYELLSKEPRSRHIFATLAQYAFYAGVGKDTAKGMGQVRLP